MATPPEELTSRARRAHRALEPVHAFIYFAAQAQRRYQEVGLRGGFMEYLASRSAALGAASAELVTATFYNFSPGIVRRVIPAAWDLASPAAVLQARLQAVDDVLAPLVGSVVSAAQAQEAADLAAEAASVLEAAGRPLYAAHASLPWPTEAHLRLWHALTLLREWRGDGHIALLVGAGIGGAEALHLHAACGGPPVEILRATRGWREPEWSQARERLIERGLLDAEGATAHGRALREGIEAATDALDVGPWRHLGERTERLLELVRPLAQALAPLLTPMAGSAPRGSAPQG